MTITSDFVGGHGDRANPPAPSDLPFDILFGEATPEQRLQCYRITAAAYGAVLQEMSFSVETFIEREKFLDDQPLTRDGGCRIWCLYQANDPSKVLSCCRTVRRDVLLTDANGVREELGYCICSVVTDVAYRRHGLATLLLRHFKEWLDGDGQSAISMLYSSKVKFYAKNGWVASPSEELIIENDSMEQSRDSNTKLDPKASFLIQEDVDKLCARDVNEIKTHATTMIVPQRHIILTTLPTVELLGLQHARADFMSLKISGSCSKVRGAIYESHTWMLWYLDIRKRCLYIQRIRSFSEVENSRIEALAALLQCAIAEACKWEMAKVVTWDLSSEICKAAELLATRSKGRISIRQADRNETLSVRQKGGVADFQCVVTLDENFAWN